MDEQQCFTDVTILDPGRDPQGTMINRCIKFQRSLGHYDDRLSDMPTRPFCMPKRVLHHLDMARHECAEAYDMLEGGWKHHKTKPKIPDMGEVAMELVDVGHFLFNAYAYMGGAGEAELVAAAVNRADDRIKVPKMTMDDAWSIGTRAFTKNGHVIEALYGYGDGAHGDASVKQMATRVNYLLSKISATAETVRVGIEQTSGRLPPASGFIYMETVPWLYACAALLPHEDPQRLFYSSFIRKNDINFERQQKGY